MDEDGSVAHHNIKQSNGKHTQVDQEYHNNSVQAQSQPYQEDHQGNDSRYHNNHDHGYSHYDHDQKNGLDHGEGNGPEHSNEG